MIKLTDILKETQTSFDFGKNEVNGIFQKFIKLPNVKKKKSKSGISYNINGMLYFIVDSNGNPIEAHFAEDRVHDFLVDMEKKGFGPNIFATLKKIGKNVRYSGFTTIVTF
jgi:hypothetical protein